MLSDSLQSDYKMLALSIAGLEEAEFLADALTEITPNVQVLQSAPKMSEGSAWNFLSVTDRRCRTLS